MSRKKMLGAACFLVFCSSFAVAETRKVSEIIASCTGLLSAEMEFAWLVSDPDADEVQKQRDTFVELLQAMQNRSERKQLLAVRIDAKMAHATLLTIGLFGSDERRADWARRQAILYKNQCQSMLLDS